MNEYYVIEAVSDLDLYWEDVADEDFQFLQDAMDYAKRHLSHLKNLRIVRHLTEMSYLRINGVERGVCGS